MEQLNFTEPEITGIFYAITLAISDRHEYLAYGNPHVDYGDEWPESARKQAEHWRQIASVCRKLGTSTIAETCEGIARSLDKSAHEYRNPEVGN